MNAPTIIILAILALIVGLAIRYIIRSHKKGACAGCSSCNTGNGCSTQDQKKMKQAMEKSLRENKK